MNTEFEMLINELKERKPRFTSDEQVMKSFPEESNLQLFQIVNSFIEGERLILAQKLELI